MDELKRNKENSSNEAAFDSLQKELRITRICSMVVAGLLVAVIAGGIYLANLIVPMVTAIQEMQPAIAKLETIDMDLINEKISQLDIEGLNEMIQTLDGDEVSEALEHFNRALEKLEKVQSDLESFSSSVSNSLSGLFGIGRAGTGNNP